MTWAGGERIVIVGASGTGKTFRAKRLVAELLAMRAAAGKRSRLVIFDPMREWWPKGATRVATRRDFLRALRAERFPLVVEDTFTEWSPLERLRDLVVLVDEAHNYATPNRIDPSFRRLCCESRHFESELVIVTQRPRHLNPVVIANATRALVLPLQHDSDRSAIEDGLGVRLPPPAAWQPVPGAGPRAREPLTWPDDFDPGKMGGSDQRRTHHGEEGKDGRGRDEDEDSGSAGGAPRGQGPAGPPGGDSAGARAQEG